MVQQSKAVDNLEFRRTVEALFSPGGVVEARAFVPGRGKKRTHAGWFNDFDRLAEHVADLDSKRADVYVTLNPVNPDLLSRRYNEVGPADDTPQTADKEIVRRRWILVDLDPERPAGISATDEEKAASEERVRAVRAYLEQRGFAGFVLADSGNGYHLLIPVDLPNDDAARKLVERFLKALAFQFTDGVIKVDTGNYNASRITKAYGVTARKGANAVETGRVHRPSRLIEAPESFAPVDTSLIEDVANTLPEEPAAEQPKDGLDVGKWLAEYAPDVEILRKGSWSDGQKWVIGEWPICDHGGDGPYIVQGAAGWIKAGCHHESCKQRGNLWKELRAHYQPEAADAGDWGDPTPIELSAPPVEKLSESMLPKALGPWVFDAAKRMDNAPPDFVAAGAIVAAGLLLGRKVGIRPKRHDDWLVIPNLWGALIGLPASMKTPSLEIVLKPLRQLEIEARDAHEEELKEHGLDTLMYEAQRKALVKQLEQAAAKGKRDEMDAIRDKLVTLDESLDEPPTETRYETNDATQEKIGELLIDNPNGILNSRDELMGWLRSLDDPNRARDRAFFLESWNGTSSYKVDRIGRGSLFIPALCLSILGGIQPGPLKRYTADALEEADKADGLLQRFQLAVWPDLGEYESVDRWPNVDAKAKAYKALKGLATLDPEKFAVSEEGEPHYLRFDDEAQEIFNDWRASFEPRFRTGELPAAIEAHFLKYRSLFASLALIFEAIDFVDSGKARRAVGKTSAMRAAVWCRYLESHAMRLYAPALKSPERAAGNLLSHIRKGHVWHKETLRKIYHNGWSGLTTADEVSAAVEILEAHGWVARETVTPSGGGRPSEVLLLHPDIRREK